MIEIKFSEFSCLRIEGFKTDKGLTAISVRRFYRTKTDPQWKPSREGITVKSDKAKTFIKGFKSELEDIDNAKVLPTRSSSKD